jgi:hypothetical protein
MHLPSLTRFRTKSQVAAARRVKDDYIIKEQLQLTASVSAV